LKTIGLIGGMSWESTVSYYQLINREVQQRLGGLHSARIVISSVDFAEIEALQRADDWQAAGAILVRAGQALAAAGADFLVLATNTMHICAEQLQAACDLPLLHIVDPTAQAIRKAGLQRVGLLGTCITMQRAFYRDRLQQFGIEAIVPSLAAQEMLHQIIFQELCRGVINVQSRQVSRRKVPVALFWAAPRLDY
jgi:aspartate racemase